MPLLRSLICTFRGRCWFIIWHLTAAAGHHSKASPSHTNGNRFLKEAVPEASSRLSPSAKQKSQIAPKPQSCLPRSRGLAPSGISDARPASPCYSLTYCWRHTRALKAHPGLSPHLSSAPGRLLTPKEWAQPGWCWLSLMALSEHRHVTAWAACYWRLSAIAGMVRGVAELPVLVMPEMRRTGCLIRL